MTMKRRSENGGKTCYKTLYERKRGKGAAGKPLLGGGGLRHYGGGKNGERAERGEPRGLGEIDDP